MKTMKPTLLGTLMIPAFLLAAGAAHAMEENNGDEHSGMQSTSTETMQATYLTETPRNVFHVDDLTGNNVRSSVEDDEDIGTIHDLVINKNGEVVAVVVGLGGFLGMGERDIAIEWDSLELAREEDGEEYIIRVHATQEALEGAAEYDKDDWDRQRAADDQYLDEEEEDPLAN
ncbi:PRC-barrel domain-containing protein [Halomonas sp. Bachu 37]|uniref:PRC-barrel domain-containing protein n=1 Tax=Halomonas kashgarensis TaxID=3084920 RepID=UPI003216C590